MPRTGTRCASATGLLPVIWAGGRASVIWGKMPRTVVVASGVCWRNWTARWLCVAVATCLAFFPTGTTAGPAVVVVLNTSSALAGVSVLVLAASSSSQRIKLSVDSCLRLDEAATIVAHWLVASIWVLGRDCDDRSNQYDDQQDQREGSVVYKEDDTHDTSDDTLRRMLARSRKRV